LDWLRPLVVFIPPVAITAAPGMCFSHQLRMHRSETPS
jgi:hypothetical protein